MPRKILHILSQRPSQTGSGITLESIISQAAHAGYSQAVIVGVPAKNTEITVGGLPENQIHPMYFLSERTSHNLPDLNFLVPGMSDVMPYPSTVWSTLNETQLQAYRKKWKQHISSIIKTFQPDLIHSHHIWLMSSLLKEVAPDIPVVTTCHSTGLRQLTLCPHLAEEVISGCRRNDHFCVLRKDHALELAESLNISPARITVIGAGFKEDVFFPATVSRPISPKDLLYVGKFSLAKGLSQLLDAFTEMLVHQPELKLNVAGGGSGPEADLLRARMISMGSAVIIHGMLNQKNLAKLMQRCGVCVLPSFYEGVPLVLVEAAACGCLLVSTDLPGVREQIAPALGSSLKLVPTPRLINVDTPHQDDLPQFTRDLKNTLELALKTSSNTRPDLHQFTWKAVFKRVESIWQSLS